MFGSPSLKICIAVMGILTPFSIANFSQTPDPTPKVVNFRYSQNPKTRSSSSPDSVGASRVSDKVETAKIVKTSISDEQTVTETKTSIAEKTRAIANRASTANLPLTEIYRVGVGDILFISLQGAPSGSTSYFTVLNDGTIDYPLASDTVFVKGLTTDEIEEALINFVKVFDDPQFVVRVREHASHGISVLGLVEKPGEKFLQREAVPLFVVRAEAIVRQDADGVIIRRGDASTESFELSLENDEKVLIYPGDIVEFVRREKRLAERVVPQFFYIGGNIANPGQKEFYPGMTLTQAVLASGGLKRSRVKDVVIRRKNSEGLLESSVFDLDAIKNGKIADPLLAAGDTIEIND